MQHKVRAIPENEILQERSNEYEFINFDMKDLQQAKDQLFGFGIGYTCEIDDLLSGLSLSRDEWEQIKNEGGIPTLLDRHVEAIESHLNNKSC